MAQNVTAVSTHMRSQVFAQMEARNILAGQRKGPGTGAISRAALTFPWRTTTPIGKVSGRSEPALRYDHNIPRLHLNILVAVTVVPRLRLAMEQHGNTACKWSAAQASLC